MLRVGDAAPAFVGRPVFGLPLSVPPPADRPPVVLFFVRDFASPFSRATMAEIQSRYADFDRGGFVLAVVTRTDLTAARDFVPRHHVLAPVIVDLDGRLFDSWQVGRDRMLGGTLKALLDPSAVRRAVDALQHGHGVPHRDVQQLGAAFVVGSDGRVAHAWYAGSIVDQPDLDALLDCARAL